MTASPFDHAFLSGLLGDEETGACLTAEADVAAMVRFERALAGAEGAEGVIPSEAAEAIAAAASSFVPDMALLREGMRRDGVVIPELVRQLRAAVGEPHAQFVHHGATSQDAIDTSLSLRLGAVFDILAARLARTVEALDVLARRDGGRRVMAHTRMQAALPVAAARKIASWRDPLVRHQARLVSVRGHVGVLHFGGPVGSLDALGDRADAVLKRLAAALGLVPPHRPRHSERDCMAELASWLSLVTGCLGKMGQDIALLAQSEVAEIRLASGGGSSAMAHKVNPVAAEVLVALARFNATLLAGMHQSLVHEGERSGAAWTLEWMILPQMIMAAGVSLSTAERLIGEISFHATA